MALDRWRMVIDVNLTGAFLFCQAVGREMIRAGGGRIVNISSINALTGGLIMPDLSNASYVASKGGLTALTRELAAKWARHGIRVNAIAPGYFPYGADLGVRASQDGAAGSPGPGGTGRRVERSRSVPGGGGVELYYRADPGCRRWNHAGVKRESARKEGRDAF